MRKLLLLCGVGSVLLLGVGCEPAQIKVEGTNSNPPPQDSNADKNAGPKPGPVGGPTQPPKGGGPAAPPKGKGGGGAPPG